MESFQPLERLILQWRLLVMRLKEETDGEG